MIIMKKIVKVLEVLDDIISSPEDYGVDISEYADSMRSCLIEMLHRRKKHEFKDNPKHRR